MAADADQYDANDLVSMNPLYGSTPSVAARPQSMTLKSITNPNYDSTVSLSKRQSAGPSAYSEGTDDPPYQTSAEMNPLYESSQKEPSAGALSDINPLYETSANVAPPSPEMNPLYEPSPSMSRHQIDPTNWATGEAGNGFGGVNPIYEVAATTNPARPETPADWKPAPDRPWNAAVNEGTLLSRDAEENAERGLVNTAADFTINELYDSVDASGRQ